MMRRGQLDLLRLGEHSVAVPARLFYRGFWQGKIGAYNFVIELGQIHHVPVEATVVLAEVTEEEGFLGLFFAFFLLADLRFLIFIYLFGFIIFFSSKSDFLSTSCLLLFFSISSCFLLLFAGIPPCTQR